MKTFRQTRVSLLSFLAYLSVAVWTGCDVIEYHPYDTRFTGARDINARNAAEIERRTAGREKICFAVLSDTQRWYDETHDCVTDINARDSVDFAIHLGDLTDFGLTREFEWMRDELERLRVPYVCLRGNHDCLGTGLSVFHAMFGSHNFAFRAGHTHFLCLNTNSLEFGAEEPVPDYAYMLNDLNSLPADILHTVVCMHAQPGSDQFPLSDTAPYFQEIVRRFPATAFCLCGHEHSTEIRDTFSDGILYYECGAAKKRAYLLFTLSDDGSYTYEVVDY